MRKRNLWLGTALLVILCAFGWSAYQYYNSIRQASSAESQLKTVEAKRGDIAVVVSAAGTLASANKVDIISKIDAQIKEVKVQENDVVIAGQELVILDDPRLRSNLEKAETSLRHTLNVYQRQAALYRQGAVSKQTEEDALNNYVLAQKDYESYREQLKDIVITAPISGTVIGEPMLAGQTVVTGYGNPMIIMTIADLNKMLVEVLVGETDIGKVRHGQNVEFIVDAYQNKVFTGRVSKISNKMITQSNSNGVYYKLTIEIMASEELLKPGMTARVTIFGDQKTNVLLVPLAAIKNINGKKYVQVKENGNTHDVPVELGIVNEEQAEILTGLTEGQQVVLFRSS